MATNVLNFWGHHWHRCVQPCTDPFCYFCEGGLAVCTRCGGAEIELTMHCPGRKTTEMERAFIADGRLDYDGRYGWIKGPRACEEISEQ